MILEKEEPARKKKREVKKLRQAGSARDKRVKKGCIGNTAANK